MANLTVAAGDDGVAGTCTPAELVAQVAAITGSVSGGDLSSTETTAVRSSVAKTAFSGTALKRLFCNARPSLCLQWR